jgi:hypothetical protein
MFKRNEIQGKKLWGPNTFMHIVDVPPSTNQQSQPRYFSGWLIRYPPTLSHTTQDRILPSVGWFECYVSKAHDVLYSQLTYAPCFSSGKVNSCSVVKVISRRCGTQCFIIVLKKSPPFKLYTWTLHETEINKSRRHNDTWHKCKYTFFARNCLRSFSITMSKPCR